MDNISLNRFFATANSRFEKCLEPAMSCTNKPINAHSIQNAKVINLLQVDGHVMSPQLKFDNNGPNLVFGKIGRNKASTFRGLCSEHDSEIFRPLDTQEFDYSNSEHLFLLAYRSVIRELYAVMDVAIKHQTSYQEHVELGLVPSDKPSPMGFVATDSLASSYQTYVYRADNFDQAYIRKFFNTIKHDVLLFENQPPSIAVSSLFSFGNPGHKDFIRCILNVFPKSTKTSLVVFSYPAKDMKSVRNRIRHILNASGEHQKYELSKLILNNIENFIVSPAQYSKWTDDKIDKIKGFFKSTMFSENDKFEDEALMLF